MLGELPISGMGQGGAAAGSWVAMETKAILAVEHRHLCADNEMRRIFGSSVVRQSEQR